MHQNIYSYSTHNSSAWLKAFKKRRTGQTQFSTKFAAKLNFMPRWSPVYFFSLFFEISSPMWPNRTKEGVTVPAVPDFKDDFIGKDFTGLYRALDLFQKQLPGRHAMQLRIRFLVTLIKTPGTTLFPSFYGWLLALQRTFSGLHIWQHDHGVDCWFYRGHFRTPQMTERQWMAHVRMAKP